ncbi:unnamed protein product [Vitrella brassicaformis CCMP3155]|uniref:Protein kinase domain-containing protein n=1 Tax=Vitrella brassicaformis (strain CCMP3155) TaxID=1169540 RepID=A0A0G4EQN8_VITBC|nr:unnamed protein product [Vitrella brassicaformis CCMP3155]|eukprot:CEL99750.1 unnamed protein product [Vitrella brassicaformis CCMP3155]
MVPNAPADKSAADVLQSMASFLDEQGFGEAAVALRKKLHITAPSSLSDSAHTLAEHLYAHTLVSQATPTTDAAAAAASSGLSDPSSLERVMELERQVHWERRQERDKWKKATQGRVHIPVPVPIDEQGNPTLTDCVRSRLLARGAQLRRIPGTLSASVDWGGIPGAHTLEIDECSKVVDGLLRLVMAHADGFQGTNYLTDELLYQCANSMTRKPPFGQLWTHQPSEVPALTTPFHEQMREHMAALRVERHMVDTYWSKYDESDNEPLTPSTPTSLGPWVRPEMPDDEDLVAMHGPSAHYDPLGYPDGWAPDPSNEWEGEEDTGWTCRYVDKETLLAEIAAKEDHPYQAEPPRIPVIDVPPTNAAVGDRFVCPLLVPKQPHRAVIDLDDGRGSDTDEDELLRATTVSGDVTESADMQPSHVASMTATHAGGITVTAASSSSGAGRSREDDRQPDASARVGRVFDEIAVVSELPHWASAPAKPSQASSEGLLEDDDDEPPIDDIPDETESAEQVEQVLLDATSNVASGLRGEVGVGVGAGVAVDDGEVGGLGQEEMDMQAREEMYRRIAGGSEGEEEEDGDMPPFPPGATAVMLVEKENRKVQYFGPPYPDFRQRQAQNRIDANKWACAYADGSIKGFKQEKERERGNVLAAPAWQKRPRYPPSLDPIYPETDDGITYDSFPLRVVFNRHKTGFEDSKDFQIPDNLVIAARFKIFNENVGQAAFSHAMGAWDMVAKRQVCLKVIKPDKDFIDQSLDEIKLLRYINSNGDVDSKCCLKLYDYFYHKEHLIIVTELLKLNLYEFQQQHRGKNYFTLGRCQKIAHQVLTALNFVHGLRLIHSDLKPENILFKSYSHCRVKVIDFGSSCYEDDTLSSYVQSRSYRAPEVILGCPYDRKVDVWSLGCIIAELWTGEVLLRNEGVPSMMARMVGLLGPIPFYMTARGKSSNSYITKDGFLYDDKMNENTDKRIKVYFPKQSSLRHVLRTSDERFVDFIDKCLQIDPVKRMTTGEALSHPWITEATYTDGLKRD